MDEISRPKAQWRADALALRDAMSEVDRIEASMAIADSVAERLTLEPGAIVSGFLPIRSEVDPRPLMMALADRGARLCVPAIVEGRLEFRQLVRGAPLVPQGFGTYAPGIEAAVMDPSIMLVPMAAFDRRCHRIGYGRGFYDRAIEALRARGLAPLLVGLAFAVQEIVEVPIEAHDEGLDFVVTEKGFTDRK